MFQIIKYSKNNHFTGLADMCNRNDCVGSVLEKELKEKQICSTFKCGCGVWGCGGVCVWGGGCARACVRVCVCLCEDSAMQISNRN